MNRDNGTLVLIESEEITMSLDDGISPERAISMSAAIVNDADRDVFCRNEAERELWDRMASEIAENAREGFGLGTPNP